MKFFCVKNLVTHSIFNVVPWEYKPNVPDYTKDNKEARKRWWSTPKTEHLFYNMLEGENEHVRVSKTNPPVKMYGFVADYDTEITPEMYEHPNLEDVPFMPIAWSLTASGRGRMVWVLERPLPLPDIQTTNVFLKVIATEMNLKKIWGGFDEAFYKSTQYYEVGHSWRVLDNNRVPHNAISSFMAKAWEKRNRNVTISIPLELIYPELERKYPGCWEGAFELGARTRRFWDREAVNPTSAILRANGFQCFSGPKAFVPWSELLDKEFIDSMVSNQLLAVTDGIFFDGRMYYRKNDADEWLSYNKEDIRLFLRVRLGLSGKPSSQASASELDRTLCYIQEANRIDVALPCVNRKPGILQLDNMRVLNVVRCKPLQPAEETKVVPDSTFPWLATYFAQLFNNEEQLPYFLAWLKRFYEDALHYIPRSGQAIFLVGKPDMGKTLLADFIIAKMVGGFRDASAFLLGEAGDFTAPFFEVPLLTVHDEHAAPDEVKHTRYSSMIKKLVANKDFFYNQKFEKAGMIKWSGRVIVSCNTDAQSMRLLPNVDISMLDKVMLFRMSDIKKNFFTGFTKHIERELPYFCRWLLEWQVPEHIKGGTRFGVKRYLHKQLYYVAKQSGSSNAFYEILMIFLKDKCDSYKNFWEGSAANLLSELHNTQATYSLVSRMNSRYVGIMLGQLQSRGYPICSKNTRNGRMWQMPYDLTQWAIDEEDGSDMDGNLNDEEEDEAISFNPEELCQTSRIFEGGAPA